MPESTFADAVIPRLAARGGFYARDPRRPLEVGFSPISRRDLHALLCLAVHYDVSASKLACLRCLGVKAWNGRER